MSKIIGIDLGTTNSVVAVMEGGEPTVITTPKAAAPRHQSWPSPKTAVACRTGCQTPGGYQSGKHCLFNQAIHGTSL